MNAPPAELREPDDSPAKPESDASGPRPSEASRLPGVATLGLGEPIRWLRLGWQDFRRAPWIGLFFGACFAAMGVAIALAFMRSPQWTLVLCGSFLMLGPFLAIGLYDVSRKLESGRPPSLGDALTAWDGNLGALVLYLGVLLVLEMLWSRSALVIFAVSFNTMPAAVNTLELLLDPENLGFVVTYLGVGAIFAGLIFATSVVSIPMIMDRDTDGISAGITSFRVCFTNPLTMFFWGALITALVVLAMLPYFAGLLIIGPVLGHASWHAYRPAVRPAGDAPAA
ncbi:MAG: DUF2189 domain-containing protein [Burkholderiaceae bacterium]